MTARVREMERDGKVYAAGEPLSTCKVRGAHGLFGLLHIFHLPPPTTVAHSTTTPIPSDSGSVSPTLVASVPGTPSDLSASASLPLPAADTSRPPTPSALAVPGTADSDGDDDDNRHHTTDPFSFAHHLRKRRADCVIELLDPRPAKLPRSSVLDPAVDHDMRFNVPGPSASASTSTSSLGLNGESNGDALPTNGYSASKSSVELVRPGWSSLYKDSQLDREQVMRVVLQALRDVGYSETAATLEAESGYKLESSDVAQFRHSIKAGLWDDAAATLVRLGVTAENELRAGRFLISQQKYLEQLEALQPTAALQTLRGELAVYCTDPERLHHLSSLIMCASSADVMERARWDGAEGTSRERLLTDLQRFISPSLMLPPRRLDGLLAQARAYQRATCAYHQSESDNFSLYTDHSCTRAQFPTLTSHILAEHTDEVWRIEWSHDGRYLASTSQDKTVIIWRIGPETEPATRACSAERVLSGHENAVNALAWSPDDKVLLTSAEQVIKMWNVTTGTSIRDLQSEPNTDMISSLVWLPDGSGFVSGSMDCHIIVWDSTGQKLHELGVIDDKPLSIRVTDLAITPDGARLVAVGTVAPTVPSGNNFDPSRQRRSMKVFNMRTKAEIFSAGLVNEVTSVKTTADSRYALISHAPDEVQLWDLDNQRMCRKYTGQQQGKHVIRSCLGGADEDFILSGSEDQRIYVWRRDTGALLEVLSGHGPGCVNDVAWNPVEPGLFASCSDDHTVRLWCPPPSSL
ncbi:WD repeat-containing protein [Ceratobasidium sp. AG-Ba]|nr:WD repeat-containing protein [Ceratobasidium sp. AG-Ba]